MKIASCSLVLSLLLLTSSYGYAQTNGISCPTTQLTNCTAVSAPGPFYKCDASYSNNGRTVAYSVVGGDLNMLTGLNAGQYEPSLNACLYPDIVYPLVPVIGKI